MGRGKKQGSFKPAHPPPVKTFVDGTRMQHQEQQFSGQFFTPQLTVVVSHIRCWQQTGLIGLCQSLYGFLIENQ